MIPFSYISDTTLSEMFGIHNDIKPVDYIVPIKPHRTKVVKPGSYIMTSNYSTQLLIPLNPSNSFKNMNKKHVHISLLIKDNIQSYSFKPTHPLLQTNRIQHVSPNKNVRKIVLINTMCCIKYCKNKTTNRRKKSLKLSYNLKQPFVGSLICNACYFNDLYRWKKKYNL